jgi:hypothetical protein
MWNALMQRLGLGTSKKSAEEEEDEESFPISDVLMISDRLRKDESAFAQALRLAVAGRGMLTLMQTRPDNQDEVWQKFPNVRSTLNRWGFLAADSQKKAVFKELGLNVRKLDRSNSEPLSDIKKHIEKELPELIVVPVGQERKLHRSILKLLIQSTNEPVESSLLFVPNRCPGFVSSPTGKPRLRNGIVLIDKREQLDEASELVATVLRYIEQGPTTITFIFVNIPASDIPSSPTQFGSNVLIRHEHIQDSIEDTLLDKSDELSSDLMVIASPSYLTLPFLESVKCCVLAAKL